MGEVQPYAQEMVTPEVSDYLSTGPQMMPLNVVVIVEFMDDEGVRSVRMARANGTPSWTALGLVAAAQCWLRRDYDDAAGEE